MFSSVLCSRTRPQSGIQPNLRTNSALKPCRFWDPQSVNSLHPCRGSCKPPECTDQDFIRWKWKWKFCALQVELHIQDNSPFYLCLFVYSYFLSRALEENSLSCLLASQPLWNMAAIEFLSGRQKRPRSAFEFIDTNSYAVTNPKRPRTGSILIKDVSEEKLDSSTKAHGPYSHSRTSSSSSSSRSSESDSDDSDSSDTLLPTDLAVPGLSPSHTSDSSSTSSSSTSDAESSITSDSELESDSDSDSDAVSISSTDSEASSGSPRDFDLLPSLLPAGIPPLTAPPGPGNLGSLATDLQARLASLIPQLAAANRTLETEREEGILQERDIENLEGEEDEYIEMVS